ncbi:MAG: preprotein translocase subunit SecG [Planctomycetes bacterium]|nr:preprotein translocase subunit SecG [Planctomycetota bacterium]
MDATINAGVAALLLEEGWFLGLLWDGLIYVCWIAFFFACVAVVGLILIRPGEGEGLAAAFGGAGGAGAFGVKMTKPIDKIIRAFGVIILVCCLLISCKYRRDEATSGLPEKPGIGAPAIQPPAGAGPGAGVVAAPGEPARPEGEPAAPPGEPPASIPDLPASEPDGGPGDGAPAGDAPSVPE